MQVILFFFCLRSGGGFLLDLPNRSSRSILLVKRTVILQIPLER